MRFPSEFDFMRCWCERSHFPSRLYIIRWQNGTRLRQRKEYIFECGHFSRVDENLAQINAQGWLMRFLSPPGAKLFGRVMDREASIIARDSSAESALALGHINGKASERARVRQKRPDAARWCFFPQGLCTSREKFTATRGELQKSASEKQIVVLE